MWTLLLAWFALYRLLAARLGILVASYLVSATHATYVTYRGTIHLTQYTQYTHWYYCATDAPLTAHISYTNDIFLAYIIVDLLHVIMHYPSLGDIDAIVHHLIFAAASYIASTHYLFCIPFCWLIVGELSTPFLNIRALLKHYNKYQTCTAKLNDLVFFVTFALTRVVLYGLGVYNMIQDWDTISTIHPAYAAIFLFTAILGGYMLNLIWFYKICRGLVKMCFAKKQISSKEK
jgi:hypothetical protein